MAKRAAAKVAEQQGWGSRIVGHEMQDPEQLLAHPFNWRIHGLVQSRITEQALDTLGWIDEIAVNQRTGRVVNGHLRVALAMRRGEKRVPVRLLDLTEEEELLALRSYDAITELADIDREKLADLQAEAERLTTDEGTLAMLRELLESSPLAVEDRRVKAISEPADEGDAEDIARTRDVAPAAVRVFTLFLTDAAIQEFREDVKVLGAALGIDSPTDVVVQAVKDARARVGAPA